MIKKGLALLMLAVLTVGLFSGCRTAAGLYIAKDGTYYRKEDGTNQTGFLKTEEGTYYFHEDGVRQEEGLLWIGDALYGFQKGLLLTGWATLDGRRYYFDAEGRAALGEREIDGVLYHFDPEEAYLLEDEVLPESSQSPVPISPSPEPSTQSPEPVTSPTPTPQPSPTPAKQSMAIGKLRGNPKLDQAVKEIIDAVCKSEYSPEKNLGLIFDWMVKELKYKFISVDLSNGYTDELVTELAEYIVLNRRGSCEHEAALMAVFNERLGYDSIVVAGEFLSDDKTEWVEHAWVLSEIDGTYYHFDPLFGRNHTDNPRSFFMKKDAEIEHLHRWDREKYPVSE